MLASLAYTAHRNRAELPAVAGAADLSAVGRVVVGVQREEAEPVANAPGHAPPAAAHPQGVEPLALGALTALDQFSAQSLAEHKLLPVHRLLEAQGFEHRPGFVLLEGQQVGLNLRIVEIQGDHGC